VRKFQGTKVPGPFRSGERKFQGAKRPGSELARVLLVDSLWGANWPGSEKAVNQYKRDRSQRYLVLGLVRSRVGRVSRVRVTLTVTVRVSRVSIMVSVRDSVK